MRFARFVLAGLEGCKTMTNPDSGLEDPKVLRYGTRTPTPWLRPTLAAYVSISTPFLVIALYWVHVHAHISSDYLPIEKVIYGWTFLSGGVLAACDLAHSRGRSVVGWLGVLMNAACGLLLWILCTTLFLG